MTDKKSFRERAAALLADTRHEVAAAAADLQSTCGFVLGSVAHMEIVGGGFFVGAAA
jgi:hypothetical protein